MPPIRINDIFRNNHGIAGTFDRKGKKVKFFTPRYVLVLALDKLILLLLYTTRN